MSRNLFRYPIEVRFRDLDAMGHVNNAVIVTYLEVARTRLWLSFFQDLVQGVDFPFVVARVSVDYKVPIKLHHKVEIEVWVQHLGRSSFTLAYRLWADSLVGAEAETVQVHYDYAQGKPIPIEGALRSRLEALLLSPSQ